MHLLSAIRGDFQRRGLYTSLFGDVYISQRGTDIPVGWIYIYNTRFLESRPVPGNNMTMKIESGNKTVTSRTVIHVV